MAWGTRVHWLHGGWRELVQRLITKRKVWASYRRALSHVKNGKPANAIDLFTSILHSRESPPGLRVQAQFQRGLAYARLRDLGSAAHDYRAVAESGVAHPQLRQAAREKLKRISDSRR